jgi:hypothetical protein
VSALGPRLVYRPRPNTSKEEQVGDHRRRRRSHGPLHRHRHLRRSLPVFGRNAAEAMLTHLNGLPLSDEQTDEWACAMVGFTPNGGTFVFTSGYPRPLLKP